MTNSGIDPRTGMWLNVMFLLFTGVAAGSVSFAGLSDPVVSMIKTYATDAAFIISVVNAVFHAYAAPAAGPLVNGKDH
jgi:hypothetical protein